MGNNVGVPHRRQRVCDNRLGLVAAAAAASTRSGPPPSTATAARTATGCRSRRCPVVSTAGRRRRPQANGAKALLKREKMLRGDRVEFGAEAL